MSLSVNTNLIVVEDSIFRHKVAPLPGIPESGFLAAWRKLLQVAFDVYVGGTLTLQFRGVGDVVEPLQEGSLEVWYANSVTTKFPP